MQPSKISLNCMFFLLSIPFLIAAAIVVFYVEENWRGPHTWAIAQAEMEQKGETTDYAKLIPPAVPDDQNLGALPLFNQEADPADKGKLKPLKLKQALENIHSDDYHLPPITNMFSGTTSDWDAISTSLSKRYASVFKPASNAPPLSALAELEALCPAMAEVREATKTRPVCRFAQDYVSPMPCDRPVSLSPHLIALAQALTLHAVLELHSDRSDLALDDLRPLFEIDTEMRREPVLISGLVASAIMQIQMGVIWEGVVAHKWSDAQLVEIEKNLKDVDFLSTYQFCLRSEAIGSFSPEMEYLKDHLNVRDIIGMADAQAKSNPFLDFAAWLIPRGWFDLGKAHAVELCYRAADECADTQARRVYPDKSDDMIDVLHAHTPYTVHDILLKVAMGPILDSCSAFAMVQAYVDEARIACQAERYRLAHGAYPKSIEELKSFASMTFPSDIMIGDPYHYVVKPNGSLLIYSVGWNLTDENGVRVNNPETNKFDRKLGDWPWPALEPEAKKK